MVPRRCHRPHKERFSNRPGSPLVPRLRRLCHSLRRAVGFSGTRHQARKLRGRFRHWLLQPLPYYMNTYGFHTIHGRAPAVATGLKAIRPTWRSGSPPATAMPSPSAATTTIHMLRRNVGIKVLLFNNKIYGLTKGQYSPTSELNKKAKSTPFGSLDRPFNPVSPRHRSEATFVARSVDVFPRSLERTLKHAPLTRAPRLWRFCRTATSSMTAHGSP